MAQITDMGIPAGFGDGILQPHHKHRWQVTFQFRGNNGGVEELTSMAIRADRPKLEFESIQLDRYNSRAFIFGKHTFQPVSITFEPDVGGKVHEGVIQQLERQQRLIANADGPYMAQAAAGELYKFGTKMEMLDGGTNVLETFYLDGCGLENNDFGDLDYQASETLQTTLTIRYDHARLDPRGTRRVATGGRAR